MQRFNRQNTQVKREQRGSLCNLEEGELFFMIA